MVSQKKVLLQAHRGVASEYPENTMASFQAAIQQGYHTIELDPAYTKDGQLVVLHDIKLNRTARNKDGSELEDVVLITDITYNEALAYDYGVGFSEKFRGEPIPLLEQALQLGKENNIRIKIDNKVERFPEEISEKLYTLLEKYDKWIGLTSADPEKIRFYAERFPKAELHYDGAVEEKILKELSVFGDRLTVWVPYQCSLTSWVKIPFADRRLCEMIKQYAKLGIWIIEDDESYVYVCKAYVPDIIETTGVIKPESR